MMRVLVWIGRDFGSGGWPLIRYGRSKRSASNGRYVVASFVEVGLGVHALLRTDVSQCRVRGWLLKRRSVYSAGVVADEVEMAVILGGDAEGLLHQPVGLVPIAIGPFFPIAQIAVTTAGHLASFQGLVVDTWQFFIAERLNGGEPASLTLHFAIGQKATRNPAGAPRFAVGPSAHTSLALVPDEDGSRFDLLALLFGQAALDSRQQSKTTCLEQGDGVLGSADVTRVGLHARHGV
jgi:hypothetical protein